MTVQLVRYEAARAALAAAHRIDEVKDIRDKAEAMAAYARQAKDKELIEHATEIKVRAERKCGGFLCDMADSGKRAVRGDNRHTVKTSDGATSNPTLAEMGLTRDESSRYQRLAKMPDEHFETAVATAKATAGEVTTAFMLRQAPREKPKVVKPASTAPSVGMQFARMAIMDLRQIARNDKQRAEAFLTVRRWIDEAEA